MADREFELWTGSGYTKVRKGVLFAKRTLFRETYTKIYDKRDDFDIVNFPFLDGDVPRSASYGVYISQLIRFARVSSHVDDFNMTLKYDPCFNLLFSQIAYSYITCCNKTINSSSQVTLLVGILTNELRSACNAYF